MKQIGTVEVLRTRTYAIDADTPEPRVEVVVEPGVFPLYEDGLARYWMMTGRVNASNFKRHGDGIFIAGGGDRPTGPEVTFPSRWFGPDEFAALVAHPTATEGNPEQRLRIAIEESA